MDIPQEELQGHKVLDVDWPFRGEIEFRNATLRYMPSLPPALRDLSLTIAGGTQVCNYMYTYVFSILDYIIGIIETTGRCIFRIFHKGMHYDNNLFLRYARACLVCMLHLPPSRADVKAKLGVNRLHEFSKKVDYKFYCS